jgi:hypothetical protein
MRRKPKQAASAPKIPRDSLSFIGELTCSTTLTRLEIIRSLLGRLVVLSRSDLAVACHARGWIGERDRIVFSKETLARTVESKVRSMLGIEQRVGDHFMKSSNLFQGSRGINQDVRP